MEEQKSRYKKLWIWMGTSVIIIAVLTGVFFWYVSDYYRADEAVSAIEVFIEQKNAA